MGVSLAGTWSCLADLDAGQDRGDDVVPEGEQGRYGPGSRAGQIVAAGARGFGDELLAAEFAQIVGGLAGVVGGVVLPGHGVDFGGHIGHGEPVGRCGEGEHGRQGGADPGLVHIDAADPAGAQLRGQRQLIQRAVGEEADIDAVQRGAEPLAHAGQPGDDLGKALQCPAAAQLAGVVGDRFEPEDARAFGVALECQQPEMDFEHRQVPRRCLEHDPDPGRGLCAVLAGTAAGPEQGPQGPDIQAGPGPVQHGVEHPVHVTAVGKQQVTGVFGLVDRVGVGEAGPLLIGQVQAEDQARGVDPPVDDLAQAPCSRILRQGVCDLGQAVRIRGTSKAVALLGEGDPGRLGRDRHVLMAVQDDLRGERRMAGHLDRQVPPPGVHDVEAVVIHIGALAGQAAEHRAVRGEYLISADVR